MLRSFSAINKFTGIKIYCSNNMSSASRSLKGKTIFITGASRGIGKAIALRCAQDGANIVIAAKTTEPHPKLPGTIYTAAAEVEKAGGKCLPCAVDIRDEDQVVYAMAAAEKKFGGIDILVNNASAISLTGTVDTPMKRFDLMMGINARGTYLCSKCAIPLLKHGKNPHILNISPPLSMKPLWFKDHVAYTMAKYGMSMCVLGMAEELKPDGIAVNALWPRTAIYTAAMEMLGGGEAAKAHCRTPDIMADAAYAILTGDSKGVTGNFFIDDDVLREMAGVTNLDKYSCVPGSTLLPDFFLETDDSEKLKELAAKNIGVSKLAARSQSGSSVSDTFRLLKAAITDDIIQSVNARYAFVLKGAEPENWHLDLKTKGGDTGPGEVPSGDKPDCTMTMSSDDFVLMFTGKLGPTSAFMSGRLNISGNMALAMKLEKLLKQMNKAKL